MGAITTFRLEDRQVPKTYTELEGLLASFGVAADDSGNVCLRHVAQRLLDLSTVAMDAIGLLNEMQHIASPALMTKTGKDLRIRAGALTEHFGKIIGRQTGETLLPAVEMAEGVIRTEFVRVPALTN